MMWPEIWWAMTGASLIVLVLVCYLRWRLALRAMCRDYGHLWTTNVDGDGLVCARCSVTSPFLIFPSQE